MIDLRTMIIAERELTPLVLNPPPNIVRVRDAASEAKLFEFLEKTKDFGHDVETTPVKDFFWRRMRTAQFGTSSEQCVIDLKEYCDGNSDILFKCQGNYGANLHLAPKLKQLISQIEKYLCSSEWIKTGVNLGFEYECWYWLFGLRTYGYYDCMLAEKCIYAGLGGSASLKNYDFYSMESMFERYFGMTIDKTLQTSFNLDDDLSDAQVEYAALDTRIPAAIKLLQLIIASGETATSLKEKGKRKLADYLYYLDSIILGDNLHEVIGIENEALGAFIDMHVHGERIDREPWKARVQRAREKLIINLKNLDEIFLPIVGSKNEAIDDALIAQLEVEWKTIGATPTDEEIKLKQKIREFNKILKKNPLDSETQLQRAETEIKLSQWEQARKAQKDVLKKKHSELKKRRTKITKLKADCEGEALVNYNSDAQLLHILCDPENAELFPKLFKSEYKDNENGEREFVGKNSRIEGLDDDTLEEYKNVPVMLLIQEYHGLSKEIGTYGDAWATEWVTKPCKEEGWLHPGDGRLHSTFNQLDAATGRSSSSQPNGQNLPQDKEVRSCFIADPPDDKYPDGYSEITIDMAGAELRILAEEANDPVWIKAFENEEDVHSVCTELVEGEERWKELAEEGCAYFKLKENGQPQRKKCKCVLHNQYRNGMKPTNFGLPYGIGPRSLSKQIGKTYKETLELMAKHKLNFPAIWVYLEDSGTKAKMQHRAFDMFGRRRLLPEPTYERAKQLLLEDEADKFLLSEELQKKNIETFTALHKREPNKQEKFNLTHRPPTANEVSRRMAWMYGDIERQGKNHRIQSANASIAKIAMALLWHILPKYDSKLLAMVHDELKILVPTIYAKEVAEHARECIKKSAAKRMKKVIMESEYHIGPCWEK
jgi:DNA polymerase I-like protein with 3'-5' exonuclease and polymerase domains